LSTYFFRLFGGLGAGFAEKTLGKRLPVRLGATLIGMI